MGSNEDGMSVYLRGGELEAELDPRPNQCPHKLLILFCWNLFSGIVLYAASNLDFKLPLYTPPYFLVSFPKCFLFIVQHFL